MSSIHFRPRELPPLREDFSLGGKQLHEKNWIRHHCAFGWDRSPHRRNSQKLPAISRSPKIPSRTSLNASSTRPALLSWNQVVGFCSRTSFLPAAACITC